MEEIKKRLLELKFKVEGVSRYEIEKIESYYSISLPEYYKDFLLFMGKSAGRFMQGESIFYDSLFDLREGLVDLLFEDGSSFELNDSHFVFYSHQGYIFAFFDVNINPCPIYVYSEEILEPYVKYESLALFLKEYLDNLENYILKGN